MFPQPCSRKLRPKAYYSRGKALPGKITGQVLQYFEPKDGLVTFIVATPAILNIRLITFYKQWSKMIITIVIKCRQWTFLYMLSQSDRKRHAGFAGMIALRLGTLQKWILK